MLICTDTKMIKEKTKIENWKIKRNRLWLFHDENKNLVKKQTKKIIHGENKYLVKSIKENVMYRYQND